MNTKHRVNHISPITSVDFHPTEEFISYGDAVGKIFSHYCLKDRDKASASDRRDDIRTEVHWHAQAVHALVFSHDGNHMLTGGEEVRVVYAINKDA